MAVNNYYNNASQTAVLMEGGEHVHGQTILLVFGENTVFFIFQYYVERVIERERNGDGEWVENSFLF